MHGQAKDTKYFLKRYGVTSDLSWVRSAAQAALALKLHGILENTGYQSTSTKLHHASLPKFSKVKGESVGIDDTTNHISEKVATEENNIGDDFEKGIICIESCLDEENDYKNNDGSGFDVLPLPVPLHKRSALCAGSFQTNQSLFSTNDNSHNEVGTNYGDCFNHPELSPIIVGDMSVDRDINKLRDLMRAVDESLKRGFTAGLLIGSESIDRINYQLCLLKEIDSGDSLCPRIIGQNALLHGVESLERNRNTVNDCTDQFVNGKWIQMETLLWLVVWVAQIFFRLLLEFSSCIVCCRCI